MSQLAAKGLAALARPTMNAVQRSAGVLATQPATALLQDPMQRSSMATGAAAPALGAKPGAAEFVMTKVSRGDLPVSGLLRPCAFGSLLRDVAAAC